MNGRSARRLVAVIALAMSLLAVAPHAVAATVWTAQPTAGPAAGQYYQLSAVSCAAPDMCMAVGSTYDSTQPGEALTELWNGATWTMEPSPIAANAKSMFMESVSCPTATLCVALGMYIDASNLAHAVAMSWNGASWTLDTLPAIANNPSDIELLGLSCLSSGWCKGVGYLSTSGSRIGAVALTRNGGTWTVDSVPSPAAAVRALLVGVSCHSTTACAAVGAFATSKGTAPALAETWNGSSWHIDSLLNPSKQTQLYTVSCTSATSCTAAGYYLNSHGTWTALIERTSGSVWVNSTGPNPAGYTNHFLEDVSCTAKSSCVALGLKWSANTNQFSYAGSWNGLYWATETVPAGTELTSLSCPTTTFCMAVGSGSATRT